ncbi:hypothetical protein ASD77_08375 [Pseudoxanthomonas sp. Root65]|uniref:hypothetical protein n=1 Tax=Pseudoxanthomonas sp. Root65 TaxID=1736576 RepID=UPI0006FED25F|nr:hypothetical protein [Pseudoxanthomonas sp. Root65]KRA54592.1 hypothetical protein ASD77_08375 [Pseudoxanthomonas sp. Root65]
MCGHCTERAALAERVRALARGEQPATDPLLLPVHLQEADNWRQLVGALSVGKDTLVAIVAMCRAWTDVINGVEPPASIEQRVTPSVHARLAEWRAVLVLPHAWPGLHADRLAPDVLPPLEVARVELDAYLAGWLGLRDRPGPPWNDAMLHERLPRVSVALDIVARDAPDDARLTALALSSPGATSPFSAIDLWLQRRALQALAARHGIAFVTGLLPHLRTGAVLALVLRGDLDEAALLTLHAALRDRPDDGNEGASDLRTALALLLDAAPAATA